MSSVNRVTRALMERKGDRLVFIINPLLATVLVAAYAYSTKVTALNAGGFKYEVQRFEIGLGQE
jgi:hypothetical protein